MAFSLSECAEGTFKQIPGDESCAPCPDNSNNDGVGNSMCTCNEGYVRADSNDVTTACSGMFVDIDIWHWMGLQLAGLVLYVACNL